MQSHWPSFSFVLKGLTAFMIFQADVKPTYIAVIWVFILALCINVILYKFCDHRDSTCPL